MATQYEVIPLEDKQRNNVEEAIRLLTQLVVEGRAPPKPKYGNPAVVGLAGFGLTTMVLQFYNLGWMSSIGPVIWLGLIFGGLAQLLAGAQEFISGNNFGYSAFITYGSFWIAFALMSIANKFNFYKSFEKDVGFFLIAFTLYTLVMLVAAFSVSIGIFVVFFSLFLGFVLLDVDHFQENHDFLGYKHAAGWVLLFCAISAWYVMAHIVYDDVYKRNILPVGPAPMEIIKNKCRKPTGYSIKQNV